MTCEHRGQADAMVCVSCHIVELRRLDARVAELEEAVRAVVDRSDKVGGFWHVRDGEFQDLAALVAGPERGGAT